MTAPHRIDVHHHILPPEYVSALAGIGITGGGGVPFPRWSAEEALGLMDRHAIQAAVTSISSPGVHFGDAAAARDLARRCNEISARLVSNHPTRFGAFATLPLPDVDGALRELVHAIDVLHLDGVVLLASQSDGRVLGDLAFDELFAELDRRRTVVFVHPTIPKSSETVPIDVPGFAAEFTFDTSRLKRFFYDTALSANPYALRSLCELVGPSQILFGTDFPFAPEPVTQMSIDGLTQYDGFDATARRAIECDNALSLLPTLRERIEAAGR